MSRHFAYPVTLTPASAYEPGERGFVVTFADVPEAITQGEDEPDALSQAADALEEALSARIKRGDDVPLSSEPKPGQRMVAVPTLTAAKAALYVAMREQQLSNVALAARLHRDEKEIRRMLDPDHGSKLPSIERALLAMGKRIKLVIEDAA